MVKILKAYGPHKDLGTEFVPEMDTTDQRVLVNDPQELYEKFVVGPDIMDELEHEDVDDFLQDIHPYDDRSEYGEDIARMAERDLADAAVSLAKQKKPVRSSRGKA